MRGGGKAFRANFVAWNRRICAIFLLCSIACSLGCFETAAIVSTFSIPCLVRKVFRSKLLQTNVSAYFLLGFWTDLLTATLNKVRVRSFLPLQVCLGFFCVVCCFLFFLRCLHCTPLKGYPKWPFLRGKRHNFIGECARLCHSCCLLAYFFNYSGLSWSLSEEINLFSHSGRCTETELASLSHCLSVLLLKSSLFFFKAVWSMCESAVFITSSGKRIVVVGKWGQTWSSEVSLCSF